jgi:hypothetical protein
MGGGFPVGLHIGRRMSAAAALAVGLVVAQGVSGAEQAQAFCTTGIGRWLHDDITPKISSNVPPTWNAAVTSAITGWNEITGSTLRYSPPQFNSVASRSGFQVAFVSTMSVGLPDVPGIALGSDVQSHENVTVVLSSDFTWNTSGIMDQASRRTDVWTILMHETGHASGLAHPVACGVGHPTALERAGVMHVDWMTKHTPNSDDRAGIAGRY